MKPDERDILEQRLRANLREQAPRLKELLDSVNDHWGYEDPIYRFYHQSFKAYYVQEDTLRIVAALQALVPELPLNSWFQQIIVEGANKQFETDHNARWLEETRPILEALFHARFFLEMACRYSEPPDPDDALPSGWAALLCLFNLR